MIKSMTAYGRSRIVTEIGVFSLEVHSVNRKNLDINIYLPKELLFLDIDMRRLIANEVKRGAVSLRITKETDFQSASFFPKLEVLQEWKAQWENLAGNLDLDPHKEISLAFLIEQWGKQSITFIPNEEIVKENMQKGLQEALSDFLKMKQTEGEALRKDIVMRLDHIQKAMLVLENQVNKPQEKYRKRLLQKLQELGQVTSDVEERLYREVVIFAEKIDITEEVVRCTAHLMQFRKSLCRNTESIGKTLDFLLQEMQREVNTMNAKMIDIEAIQKALFIKGELEKIREQVQNLE